MRRNVIVMIIGACLTALSSGLQSQSRVRVSEPMLIDLGGDGIVLTGAADGVTVDIDGDGKS